MQQYVAMWYLDDFNKLISIVLHCCNIDVIFRLHKKMNCNLYMYKNNLLQNHKIKVYHLLMNFYRHVTSILYGIISALSQKLDTSLAHVFQIICPLEFRVMSNILKSIIVIYLFSKFIVRTSLQCIDMSKACFQ